MWIGLTSCRQIHPTKSDFSELLISNMPLNGESLSIMQRNQNCFDCGSKPADWISHGFGISVCVQCSGYHRHLGVHLTTVRSLRLDDLSQIQLSYLQHGGNDLFKKYLDDKVYDQSTTYAKYLSPVVLYYREVLKNKVEGNMDDVLPPFDEKYIQEINISISHLKDIFMDKTITGVTSLSPTVAWIPNESSNVCMICEKPFSYCFLRRHHCRRCGKCVCSNCAPKNNTRPILEWGLKTPVRHCKLCYRSPNVDWDKIDLSSNSSSIGTLSIFCFL